MKADQLEPLLQGLKEYQDRISEGLHHYYDEEKDRRQIQRYYAEIDFHLGSSREQFQLFHALVRNTHNNRLPYFKSKDQYLYSWVDLQPDGRVKSIYSGENSDPAELLKEDLEVRKRLDEYDKYKNQPEEPAFSADLKFNAEHIVPQSWFGGREPMKGDLHHLFACEPSCNASRSNFAYFDFPHYEPESPAEKIRNHCGVASIEWFEPEYGKGTAARAMLYFMLRYPGEVRKPFRKNVNFNLLREWCDQFPPGLYEKHRNQAIYEIQGNRNPFIDFPELADTIYFPLRW